MKEARFSAIPHMPTQTKATMSTILVVMYSFSGTSRRIAEVLHQQQSWPVAEVLEPQVRHGVQSTWRSLLDRVLQRQASIRYEGPPPNEFDAVVLVAPSWAYRYGGPMARFLTDHKECLPDVSVLAVTNARVGNQSLQSDIDQLLDRSSFLSMAFTKRELDFANAANRILAFGNAIKAGQDTVNGQGRQASLLNREVLRTPGMTPRPKVPRHARDGHTGQRHLAR